MCDASDFAVAAVLGQRKDKAVRVVYYSRKTLDDAQRNYATIEKELHAVVYAPDKFRTYLLSSKEYDLEIRDKKGAKNVVADHLSRHQSEPIADSFPDNSLR
ncbi:hypothetical protein vseg_000898 [Gypsophila vaccaria]